MKTSVFLFIYSSCKAFLPLASLEVVLIPMCSMSPNLSVYYIFISSIGTMFGSSLAYCISYYMNEQLITKLIHNEKWKEGKQCFQKYGWFAVVFIAITPIPDFIVGYLAGVLKMNYFVFILSDCVARTIRSILVVYCFLNASNYLNMSFSTTYFLYAILLFLFIKSIIVIFNRIL